MAMLLGVPSKCSTGKSPAPLLSLLPGRHGGGPLHAQPQGCVTVILLNRRDQQERLETSSPYTAPNVQCLSPALMAVGG